MRSHQTGEAKEGADVSLSPLLEYLGDGSSSRIRSMTPTLSRVISLSLGVLSWVHVGAFWRFSEEARVRRTSWRKRGLVGGDKPDLLD